MAKVKAKKKVLEPVVEQVTGADGEEKTMIRMVEKRYQMVPVDLETHSDLMELCVMRGFGKRGQGAMVRILVKDALTKTRAELEKLK